MILITLREQNGEREYFSYHYIRNMTTVDYHDNPNKTEYELDVEIMTELGYEEFEDDYEEGANMWWFDTSLIGVDEVRHLSETRFETLKELGIL